DVEAAHGFDGVAEELDADGALGLGGEDIENATAKGILADHFHGLASFIPDAVEVDQQVVQRQVFTYAQGECELAVEVTRLRLEQRRCDGCDGDGNGSRGQAPKSGGALLGDFVVRR